MRHGSGVSDDFGNVVPSAAVREAGARVILRDEGDKEIPFASALAAEGRDRFGTATSEIWTKSVAIHCIIRPERFPNSTGVFASTRNRHS
jgi:hypothetical protein